MTKPEINPMRDRTTDEDHGFAPRSRGAHAEGSFTRMVEQQTARVPSAYFLAASLASMGVSAGLLLLRQDRLSQFVGMWAPTLLITGVYNKLVKTLGAP
jgi:hypothetical protein